MKLKQFYNTLNQDIPFNELSVENLDILEQSDAYKRWLTNNRCSDIIPKPMTACNSMPRKIKYVLDTKGKRLLDQHGNVLGNYKIKNGFITVTLIKL